MKWSDLNYNKNYPYDDENRKAVLGFFLKTNGIDLENLPEILINTETKLYQKSNNKLLYKPQRVMERDVIGTTYNDYANESILLTLKSLQRASYYIENGYVTKNKYFKMLKADISKQNCPVYLIKDKDKFYVSNNGNHRIVFYKILMLTDCINNSTKEKLYWLNANVCDLSTDYNNINTK